MFEDNHPFLLEVLKNGIVLRIECIFWNELKEKFDTKLTTESSLLGRSVGLSTRSSFSSKKQFNLNNLSNSTFLGI